MVALLLLLPQAAAAGGEPSSGRVALQDLAIEESPTLGPPGAAVTIVEFADFACMYCARSASAFRRLLAAYPEQVRWVFKHFPLRGPRSDRDLAHLAAQAAAAQDKFWPMHALLFQHQRLQGRDDVGRFAAELNLDGEAFARAIRRPQTRSVIARDIDLGRHLNVTVTPTYFINGHRVIGTRSFPDLRRLVEEEMGRPAVSVEKAGMGRTD